jgi:hypothetical protein
MNTTATTDAEATHLMNRWSELERAWLAADHYWKASERIADDQDAIEARLLALPATPEGIMAKARLAARYVAPRLEEHGDRFAAAVLRSLLADLGVAGRQ